MNTLSSVASTAQSVIPPPCILPLSVSSPESHVGVPHKQELVGSHGPSCFKLLFLEAGEGWYHTGDHKIRAVPGDLFLTTPDEVHDTGGPEGTKNWSIVFAADALAPSQTSADTFLELLDELLLPSFLEPKGTEIGHFQVAPADRPQWLIRLQQLERELDEKSLGFAEAARALLMLLLTDTARLAASQLRQRSHKSHPLLTSVFLFIEKHYRNQISLCDVAKAVDRAPAYLTDFVRRETGRTVLNWIIERRLAEARRLLLMTNQSVEQIAEAVGYFDTGHFIRQFRRLHDMTPRAWRNIYRT